MRIAVDHARVLDDLDLAVWDRGLGGPAFYIASPWLAAVEAVAPTQSVRYFQAQDERDGYLKTVGYLLDERSPFVFSRPDAVFHHEHEQDGASLLPAFTLGGLNPSHSAVWISSSVGADDRAPLFRAFLDEVEAEAASMNAKSVALLYSDYQDLTHQVFTAAGYESTSTGPAAVLDVPHGTFDDYLSRLSRSQREVARRDRRRCADGDVAVTVEELRPLHVDFVVSCEAQLYEKYGTPYRPEVMRALYEGLAAGGHSSMKIAVTTLREKPIGFALFFHWSDVIHARCTGYDYESTASLPVYFETLFYALVEYAQSNAAKEIRYSTGSLDVKASRGCRLVPQHAYLKRLT